MELLPLLHAAVMLLAYIECRTLSLSTQLSGEEVIDTSNKLQVPMCQCEVNATLRETSLVCSSRNGSDEVANLSELVKWDCQFVKILVFNLDINSISADAFVSNPDLQVVHLYSSFVEEVDEKAFRSLRALVDVDLSDNSLLSVDPHLFVDNSLLRSVSLAGNPLIDLKPNAPILESTSITSLDLSMCKLTSLSVESFSKLPSLSHLDLSSNNFQQLHVTVLQSMPQLYALQIGNNRWRCDCAFQEVVDFARSMKETDDEMLCFGTDRILESWSDKTKNKYCPYQQNVTTILEVLQPPRSTENPIGVFFNDFQASNELIIVTVVGVVVSFVVFVTIVTVLLWKLKSQPSKKNRQNSISKEPLIPEKTPPICRQECSRFSNGDSVNGHIYEHVS